MRILIAHSYGANVHKSPTTLLLYTPKAAQFNPLIRKVAKMVT